MEYGYEPVIALITAIVALVGVLVSVFTLSQSARKDAFGQLQLVVNELKTQLKDANDKIETLEQLLHSANDENDKLRNAIKDREERIEELSDRVDAQDALIASLKTEMDMKK